MMMKQINLLPRKPNVEEGMTIHPFWKNYLYIMILLVIGVSIFAYVYSKKIAVFENQLMNAQSRLAGLEEGVHQFQTLVTEQNALSQSLLVKRYEIGQMQSRWVSSQQPMLAILSELVQSMPDSVTLDLIRIDTAKSTVLLEGTANQKQTVFRFVEIGLSGSDLFQEVEISTVSNIPNQTAVSFEVVANLFQDVQEEGSFQ